MRRVGEARGTGAKPDDGQDAGVVTLRPPSRRGSGSQRTANFRSASYLPVGVDQFRRGPAQVTLAECGGMFGRLLLELQGAYFVAHLGQCVSLGGGVVVGLCHRSQMGLLG